MTLSQLLQTLQSLEALKDLNSKHNAQIANLLASEATTCNVAETQILLTNIQKQLKNKHHKLPILE